MVEGAPLLRVYTGNGIESSNLFLSASVRVTEASPSWPLAAGLIWRAGALTGGWRGPGIMLRRTLLAAALAAIAFAASAAHAQTGAKPKTFDLVIDGVYTELDGGEVVFAVSFRDPLTRKVNPQLRVRAGEDVVIHVANRTDTPHAFEIMSLAGTKSAPIPAGAAATLRFKAPAQGGYIYHDPLQARGKGVRTLFGDFIVTR